MVILLNPQWIIYDPQVSIWITRGIALYIFLSALIGIISLMSHVLVAVAWPYANGPRHIGHVAGFGVPSDVYARYERMKGNDVLMVSGTDEHGTPILVQAEAEGVSPQELADRYNRVIAQDLCDLGLSYDLFTRTTTKNHEKVVQSMFTQCLKNGYIYKGTQMVAISPSSGRTLTGISKGPAPSAVMTVHAGTSAITAVMGLIPLILLTRILKLMGRYRGLKKLSTISLTFRH